MTVHISLPFGGDHRYQIKLRELPAPVSASSPAYYGKKRGDALSMTNDVRAHNPIPQRQLSDDAIVDLNTSSVPTMHVLKWSPWLVFGSTLAAQLSSHPPVQYITATDGIKLAYRDFNNNHCPNQTTLVMTHGVFSSSTAFFKQAQSAALAPYRLILWDQRGFGWSEKPLTLDNYTSHELQAQDLNSIIKKLHLNRPIISAWSAGTLFVADYLAKYGDSGISGVQFIDPVACANEACISSTNSALPIFDFLLSSNQTMNLIGTENYATSLAYNMSVSLPDGLIIAGSAQQAPVPVVLLRFQISELNYNTTLESLKVPVLLQYGSNDDIYVYPPNLQSYKSLIPNLTSKSYKNGGHISFILKANEFNTDLAAWLGQF